MMGGAGGRVNTCGIQQPEEDICQCPQQRDTIKTSNSGAPQKGVPPTAAENHNLNHDPRGGVKTAYSIYISRLPSAIIMVGFHPSVPGL